MVIRQLKTKASQNPDREVDSWTISFNEDGENGNCWNNPLMGWVSSADAMSATQGIQMDTFKTAKEAVYFAKKKGWNYEVKTPVVRERRSDGAFYQDNFLPQSVAKLVKREGTKCDWWKRPNSMSSHYFRPLKYHGDGAVAQYGPNPDAEIAPHVTPVKKIR